VKLSDDFVKKQLYWYFLIYLEQTKNRQKRTAYFVGKKSGFLYSGFVKASDELLR
jgi:hypothetical protein